ncbi:MAG: hypothetical protein PHZ07_03265 [Patescibacteria group bacterium]|nr:hypothetical protein [Patescibacteria group bacterium]MDD4304361.1 hypothetical protein [Patescibacteria group bacterium]MDD4695384.1 hypothetical protein [Patescibacteria group bacterium]
MNKDILTTLVVGIKLITDKDHKKTMSKNITHHLAKIPNKEVENFIEGLNNENDKGIIIANWHTDFLYIFNYCSQNSLYNGLRENLIHRKNEISKNHLNFYKAMRKTLDVEIWRVVILSNVVNTTVLKRAVTQQMDSKITQLFKKRKKYHKNNNKAR